MILFLLKLIIMGKEMGCRTFVTGPLTQLYWLVFKAKYIVDDTQETTVGQTFAAKCQ